MLYNAFSMIILMINTLINDHPSQYPPPVELRPLDLNHQVSLRQGQLLVLLLLFPTACKLKYTTSPIISKFFMKVSTEMTLSLGMITALDPTVPFCP